MRELNKKVFKTIFFILSFFVVTGTLVYNVSSYKKEYDNIKRNLGFIEEEKIPEPSDLNPSRPNPKDRDLDNMMIMDYEVYTVKLDGNKIERIINHSNNSSFDVQKVAQRIINNKEELKVGNLYFDNYSYNYKSNTIVIINIKSITNRLIFTLIYSIIILLGFEIIIYYVSKKITQRITKPAKEAFDKQKEFIADASHELKTPLAVIMASSDELKGNNRNQIYIDNIKYESERMSTLIKSLLDLSKLENGVFIDSYREENLSKIAQRVCLTFDSIVYENNIKIETDIEKDIMFKCSKEEMERLFSIILDNAVKHGYKKSTIYVILNKNKNVVNIEIINSGDSIKVGDEEKIFERFYRGDKSRNRESNRYGLGLAIAKNIVINHGGMINAYSFDGKTTFKISFKK